MKWYLAKLVYRIVCGDGNHQPQFDEQLRLIAAEDEDLAFEKALSIGRDEEESFYNLKQQPVQWQFINISELYRLSDLIDGAELYSRINEVDDAEEYIELVNRKASSIKEKSTRLLLKLV